MYRIDKKQSFLVKKTTSISEIKDRIEQNDIPIVFVINEQEQIIGSVTDGDVKRFEQQSLNYKNNGMAVDCMFHQPVTVQKGSQRRNILSLFDRKIHAIPEIDERGRLVSIITVDDYKFPYSTKIVTRAKSPVRISFSGGGTDLSYYFSRYNGAVLNTTIRKYAYALLEKRNDKIISIGSNDYDVHEEIESIEHLDYSGKLGLIKAVIKLLSPDFGFNLMTYSEAPPGSGLGGSSVLSSAVIGCFNKLRDDELTSHEIAELAFQAERIELKIQGGWQDQYATVFGGFNFIEFFEKETVVHPLRVDPSFINELESNLLLCFSGKSRNSGIIHDKQSQNFVKNEKNIAPLMRRSKEIASEMKKNLLKGNIRKFGLLLDETWSLKKQYTSSISDNQIDIIYDFAKENGALGGKILGAGGGGYFLFYVEPSKRRHLVIALQQKGYSTEAVSFDGNGLRAWSVKA